MPEPFRDAADRPAAPWFQPRRTLPLSHMIEASVIATRHGQSSKIGLLRYIFGIIVALAVLFGLFFVAGMEF